MRTCTASTSICGLNIRWRRSSIESGARVHQSYCVRTHCQHYVSGRDIEMESPACLRFYNSSRLPRIQVDELNTLV